MIVTTSEIQNNFGKYLKMSELEEIVITKNGKSVAKLVPCSAGQSVGESSDAYGKSRTLSYEDFIRITADSENRYEYIDEEVFLIASPLYSHQFAVGEIFGEFLAWFRDKECRPLLSPFDVTLFRGKSKEEINVVQPDILVICDLDAIDEKGKYHGTPALVVEVLSDSTRNKDLIKKLDLYMTSGVQEYWVINPVSYEIYVYEFNNLSIENMLSYKGYEEAKSGFFAGLSVRLERVFCK